jgi:hypothetical protein
LKVYQYDDIRKLNQALDSFDKSGSSYISVKFLVVDGKVQFFVLANPLKEPIKIESGTEKQIKSRVKKGVAPHSPIVADEIRTG